MSPSFNDRIHSVVALFSITLFYLLISEFTGFAAIKCTALGNPILLERMSSAIVQLRSLFQELDTEKNG